MEHKKEIIIGLSIFIIVVGIGTYFYFNLIKRSPTVATNAISTEPTKTDFGENLPIDFPTNIPVESGVKVNQSYSLDYIGQKQLTIVFPSTKTIKQNYDLYTDFLKKDNWAVSNKYESITISSLYGTKERNDINVTISAGTGTSTKSQVSISVLKK